VLQLAAPQGYKIDHVVFASYGTPIDYTIDPNCHAVDSLSIVKSAIQNESLVISASNDIFGDPCGGVYKQLSVILAIQDLPQVIVDPTPSSTPTPPPAPKSEPLFLNDPTNLSAVLDTTTQKITLTWTAPTKTNTSPERYAIMWFTNTTNGWGIATGNVGDSTALNTTITIQTNIIGQDGLDKNYMFSVRADNDTLKVYSNWSNLVTVLVPDFARIAAEKAAIDAKIAADKAAADAAVALERARIAAALAAQAEADRIAAEKAIAEAKSAQQKAAAEAKAAEDARILAEQQAKEAEAARLKAEEDARIQAEKNAQAKADAAKAEADAKAKAEADAALAAQQAKDEAARIAQELANAKAEADKIAADQAAKDQAAKNAKAQADAAIQAQKDAQAKIDAQKTADDKAKQDAIGVKPNSPDQLSDTIVKEAPKEVLVPHIQEDKPGIENGGIEFFGTKTAPQVVGEDGNLTPPAPPPGSGLPIPPDAITTQDTFIGQPGGTTFNAPDIAVPVIETPLPDAIAAVPGAQAVNAAYVALANIGNDMSPVTRKKAKKILVLTVAVAAIRRRFGA
jgi:hypothetical protein